MYILLLERKKTVGINTESHAGGSLAAEQGRITHFKDFYELKLLISW